MQRNKMKFDLNNPKLVAAKQSIIRLLPVICVVAFVLAFSVLTYLALAPRDDDTTVAAGEQKLNELNLSFNGRLLKSLSSPETSSGSSSARNPFVN